MNCQVPHVAWAPPVSRKDEHLNRRKVKEDRFVPDSRLTCPSVGFRSDGNLEVIAPEGNVCKPLPIDLNAHHTLPLPLLTPTTTKCGKGPFPKNVGKPHEQNRMLCEANFALECRLQIGNYKGLTMNTIKSAWKDFLKGEELPPNLQCLQTIMNRYDYDESPTETYVGGNLATLYLESERYLIHSVTEWDCALCLTRMTTDDMKNRPMEVGIKLPLDGGTIYQIVVPRQPCLRKLSMIERNDSIFATRQLYTSRLWAVNQSEDGCRPIITNIQENCDTTSTVRCLDLNPGVRGELCELRSTEIKISQDGYLLYRKKLELEYDSCIYTHHPKTVILNTRQKIDLLDTRCSQDEGLKPVFSIENQDLHTYYNFAQNESIVCMAASSRDHINFIGTQSSLLVWDIRSGNRPLSRTGHLMDSSPNWITSVQIGSDEEWLFLNSQTPSSSSMLGLSWGNQRLCVDNSSDILPIVTVEIDPQKRWTILDSLDVLQRKGLGMDWSTQNRFNQMLSGLTCAKDNDGTVQIWQCNVAGDIFAQQLNVNDRIGSSQEKASEDIAWLHEWIEAAEDIEESLSSPAHVDQTERFVASSILEVDKSEMDLGKSQRSAYSLQEFAMPDALEQHCSVDRTKNADGRALNYNDVWAANSQTISQNCFPLEDTFAHDFEDELISSTPLQSGTNKTKPVSFPGLMLSTPAVRRMKPNWFSTPIPIVASTPHQEINRMPFNAYESQTQKPDKSRMWDDF